MYGEVLAAYLEEGSLIKVAARDEGKFGTGDFSVTLLFSADSPGLLVHCMEASANGHYKGWYLALQEDASLLFSTSDGKEVRSVVSSPVPYCFDGYLYHLAATRSDGSLRLYLEDSVIADSEGAPQSLDVSCGADLVFGGRGPGRMAEAYWGILHCVTLWSQTLPEALFDYTASDVLPHDKNGLKGWWPLDGTMTDRSPCARAITFCEGVSYLPVFDMALAENDCGYLYGNVGQTVSPAGESTPIRAVRRGANGDTPAPLRRKITIPVDRTGSFFGTCCARGPLLAYPEGVTLTVTSPSGKSLRDMVSTDKQLVVLHEGSVYQFLLTEPEQGDWVMELTAQAGSSFDLDYQFIPNGATREQLTQTMNGLYPQFLDSTCADQVTPTTFLFPSLAKIMTYDINQQLAEKKNKPENERMVGDPVIVVGAVCLLLGVVAAAGFCCWGLFKGIQAAYNWAFSSPEKKPAKYDWQSVMSTLNGYYDFSPLAWDVYASIQDKFNGTVPTRPSDFYTRADLNKIPPPGNYLHLDVGGEGCFFHNSILSGFRDAININTQTNNSQYADIDIPFLILLDSWESKWPFGDGSADRITTQGTPPYNDLELAEATRCIRAVYGARIDVWTARKSWQDFRLEKLASMIRTRVSGSDLRVRVIEDAPDAEFAGRYPISFAKYSVELY